MAHQSASQANYQSIVEMFNDRVAQNGNRTALRQKQNGAWRDYSWRDWQDRSKKLAAGLASLGIEVGDRVALISNSRAEWAFSDIGVLYAGGVVVPIYQSNLADETAYILNDCEAKIVICEDPTQLEKIFSERANLPKLTRLIYFDRSAELEKADARGRKRVSLEEVLPPDAGDFVLSFDQVLQKGEQVLAEKPALPTERTRGLTRDKLMTLVYTSGTTGKPKGVILTHGNFIFECEAVSQVVSLTSEDEQFLFLPLAHIFARVLMMAAIRQGFTTSIDATIANITKNCQEIQPTVMGAVPRVYEKAYARIKGGIESATGLKKALVGQALKVGRQVSALRMRGEEPTGLLAFQHRLFDKLVYAKRFKSVFGGRIRFFVSGGAPLSREIAEFFHAIDILILEGYGLTETCAATTVNRPDAYKFGTVGQIVPGTDIKIAEDGEILIAGPNVLQGYYNKPEETAAALEKIGDTVWFHTGDIGEIDAKGYVRITDRKKDLFKTSGGKYIAPQVVENALKAQSRYVSQVMAYGENQNYVTALVTLNEENLVEWAKENGQSTNGADLAKNPKVRELIQEGVSEVNKKLPQYEQIKKFAIAYPDFSIESGELTPTLKVKRKVVTQKYKEILDGFYSDRNQNPNL